VPLHVELLHNVRYFTLSASSTFDISVGLTIYVRYFWLPTTIIFVCVYQKLTISTNRRKRTKKERNWSRICKRIANKTFLIRNKTQRSDQASRGVERRVTNVDDRRSKTRKKKQQIYSKLTSRRFPQHCRSRPFKNVCKTSHPLKDCWEIPRKTKVTNVENFDRQSTAIQTEGHCTLFLGVALHLTTLLRSLDDKITFGMQK